MNGPYGLTIISSNDNPAGRTFTFADAQERDRLADAANAAGAVVIYHDVEE